MYVYLKVMSNSLRKLINLYFKLSFIDSTDKAIGFKASRVWYSFHYTDLLKYAYRGKRLCNVEIKKNV